MAGTSKKRILLLDELRGFAVICMVFYHGFYLAAYLFQWEAAIWLFSFFQPAEPAFAGLFIWLSGIAALLTRSNLRRGIRLFLIALAINFATHALVWFGIDGLQIKFGILNLLSVCMLLAAALVPIIKRIPPMVGMLVSVILFLFTLHLEDGYLGLWHWTLPLPAQLNQWGNLLFPLGILPDNFYSADYFPLLPWIFLFFGGMSMGVWAANGKFPAFTYRSRIRPFAFVGRHALIIYILHQPILFGLFYLVQFALGHI